MTAISETVVILVGGQGTRLGNAAEGKAKPLVEVGGRPFLDFLLLNLVRYGFRRCVLLCGHRADQFLTHYSGGAAYGMAIECLIEDQPAGTGGAVIRALDRFGDRFLLLNGDSFFDIDPLALRDLPRPEDWAISMALRRVPDTARFGRITQENGRITDMAEKTGGGPGLINAGIYWINRSSLSDMPTGTSSLERDILPRLISENRVWGQAFEGTFIDIGAPEDLARARRDAAELFGHLPAVPLNGTAAPTAVNTQ